MSALENRDSEDLNQLKSLCGVSIIDELENVPEIAYEKYDEKACENENCDDLYIDDLEQEACIIDDQGQVTTDNYTLNKNDFAGWSINLIIKKSNITQLIQNKNKQFDENTLFWKFIKQKCTGLYMYNHCVHICKEKVNILTTKHGDLVRNMSFDDISAITLYTTNHFYKHLNNSLKQGKDEWAPFCGPLISGLKKLPFVLDKLYRGTRSKVIQKQIKQCYKVGAILRWDSFTSTFKDFNVAATFCGDSGTIFEIESGCRGRDISLFSAFPLETEVLFNLSSHFIIAKIDTSGQITTVTLRELPFPWDSKTILWVDDNPANNKEIMEEFEANGIMVIPRTSTYGATCLLRFIKNALNINTFDQFRVITDMHRVEWPQGDRSKQPVEDRFAGVTLIQELRNLGYYNKICIFTTNTTKAIDKCKERGVYDDRVLVTEYDEIIQYGLFNDNEKTIKIKEGWLVKKSKYLATWRKRYTVLEKHANKENVLVLATFINKSKKQQGKTDSILIDQNTDILKHPSNVNEFSVHQKATDLIYEFKANSIEERNDWFDILRYHCVDNKQNDQNTNDNKDSTIDDTSINTEDNRVEMHQESIYPQSAQPAADICDSTENEAKENNGNVSTQKEMQQFADSIRNSLISTEKLLNLTNQLKSNEVFRKQLTIGSNLIVEYTTGDGTNESSSQSNDSGETKSNSDDEKGNGSTDDSSPNENNHNDDHDENNNNDQNKCHKCITHEYNCNVSWHAVRLKQLEEENRELKLLLQKQTTTTDEMISESNNNATTVEENKNNDLSNTPPKLKVSRRLTKKEIPNKTDESFCNVFDYMNQYFHIHHDIMEEYKSNETEVKIIDCGIPCKTTKETLYVVCHKQNESDDTDILWKTNNDLYSASELEQIYKISKEHLPLPVTINDKAMTEIKNAKDDVTRILQNKTHRNNIIGSKKTPWNYEEKIPIFNKTSKQNGLTLIYEKQQFVQKVKTFGDTNAHNIQLIPIVRFDNENRYFYEVAWVIEIEKDINIAISFKRVSNDKYLPSAIYLDIHDAHKLVTYKHNCKCLTNFNCFIDRLQIGGNKQTRTHQRERSKMEQKINEQQKQINEHEKQMRNYLQLREQDMLIIDDVKLTCTDLQHDLHSLLQLQCTVNQQQKICNQLHQLNTVNTLCLNSQIISSNQFQGYSNQLTTQINNLNSNSDQQ